MLDLKGSLVNYILWVGKFFFYTLIFTDLKLQQRKRSSVPVKAASGSRFREIAFDCMRREADPGRIDAIACG
jgi:hypothetical protein